MTILITGVAGFVGSNLAKAMIEGGKSVAGIDNLSLGRVENLAAVMNQRSFSFTRVDLADLGAFRAALSKIHAHTPIAEVWHLAANSDIPTGTQDASVDFRDTLVTTFNTLRLMKELRIPVIAFSSSSAIYGDLGDALLDENSGPLLPISNYGAAKLGSEALISAAVEDHLSQAFIFRFPNVVGTPATHGVILDFVRKLRASPGRLTVLGDGTQRKGYLHVDELVRAMMFVRERDRGRRNVYNIGTDDEGVTVRVIAEEVTRVVSPDATIVYGAEDRGWVGDVPRFRYSIAKLEGLGWESRWTSLEAIRRAIREIVTQESKR